MLTTHDIFNEYQQAVSEADRALTEHREMIIDWANKENAYRVAKAKAFLEAEGTVDARKAKVDLLTVNERIASHVAEEMKGNQLQKVRFLASQVYALKEIAATMRNEIGLAGRQEEATADVGYSANHKAPF